MCLYLDDTDFEPGLSTVVFGPEQTLACGQVPIIDDDNPETPEVFMVTFSPVNLEIPPRPNATMVVAEVTIIDDDEEIGMFILVALVHGLCC